MGSECTCVATHGDPSRPCAFCRRSEDWRDTEITRLRSELEAARFDLVACRLDADRGARSMCADWNVTTRELMATRKELEAARAMVPSTVELAALVNCMVWSEKAFGDDNTRSITRAWLARVEAALRGGEHG
jgi:hypothetical protein